MRLTSVGSRFVPKSSRNVILQPDARIDLRDIARFTRRQWGAQQSLAYMQKLRSSISRLGYFPELGRERPEYGPDVRSLPVEQHRIFYLMANEAVEILRIVHMRTSDPESFTDG